MDSAGQIAEIIEQQLLAAFDPVTAVPTPLCAGCTPHVVILAGDSVPLDSVGEGECGCGTPFLWVRFARRFRTSSFPHEDGLSVHCGLTPVAVFEAGVARCVAMGEMSEAPSDADRRTEAFCLMDDAWRIDQALCRAGAIAVRDSYALQYSLGTGEPIGPEGGLVCWREDITIQMVTT